MLESVSLTFLVDDEPGTAGLEAEHGLACLVRTEGHGLLFDTGSHGAVVANAVRLGLELETIDVVVLSHGHYDHVGGLVALTERLGKEIRVVAHPGFDGPHRTRSNGRDRDIGVNRDVRGALARVRVERHRGPGEVVPGVWTTGQIPRLQEERGERVLFRDPAGTVPDLVEDDQALVISHRAGLVVLLGCAHAGVIGTVRHVRALFPGVPLLAVAGGMHLAATSTARLTWTLEMLARQNIGLVAPAHCTGRAAKAALRGLWGPRFREVSAGTRIDLEAN